MRVQLSRKIKSFHSAYPPYLIMYPLLLRLPCGAIWIEFPRAQILVNNVQFGIPLENARVNRWQHLPFNIPRKYFRSLVYLWGSCDDVKWCFGAWFISRRARAEQVSGLACTNAHLIELSFLPSFFHQIIVYLKLSSWNTNIYSMTTQSST